MVIISREGETWQMVWATHMYPNHFTYITDKQPYRLVLASRGRLFLDVREVCAL